MKNLESYSVIIFDLDNTLYNEIEYLNRAFNYIGHKISQINKNCLPDKIHEFLLNEFKLNGRKNLYQKLVDKLNINNYQLLDFLTDLRTVPIKDNSIKLNSELFHFINTNIDNFKFIIATNGNIIQQQNKIRSIDIPFKNKFKIVYCDMFGLDNRKPSPFFIHFLRKKYKFNLDEMIFIGDSDTDKLAALNGKIDFLNIGEFCNEYLIHN